MFFSPFGINLAFLIEKYEFNVPETDIALFLWLVDKNVIIFKISGHV